MTKGVGPPRREGEEGRGMGGRKEEVGRRKGKGREGEEDARGW